jgi:uncharacterized protein YjbJ (UPF0337 family)
MDEMRPGKGSSNAGCDDQRSGLRTDWYESAVTNGESTMDKDRIEGAAKQAKGTVKEVVGKVVGDSKLTAEGKTEKVEGKIQNAIGGIKDALKK